MSSLTDARYGDGWDRPPPTDAELRRPWSFPPCISLPVPPSDIRCRVFLREVAETYRANWRFWNPAVRGQFARYFWTQTLDGEDPSVGESTSSNFLQSLILSHNPESEQGFVAVAEIHALRALCGMDKLQNSELGRILRDKVKWRFAKDSPGPPLRRGDRENPDLPYRTEFSTPQERAEYEEAVRNYNPYNLEPDTRDDSAIGAPEPAIPEAHPTAPPMPTAILTQADDQSVESNFDNEHVKPHGPPELGPKREPDSPTPLAQAPLPPTTAHASGATASPPRRNLEEAAIADDQWTSTDQTQRQPSRVRTSAQAQMGDAGQPGAKRIRIGRVTCTTTTTSTSTRDYYLDLSPGMTLERFERLTGDGLGLGMAPFGRLMVQTANQAGEAGDAEPADDTAQSNNQSSE